MTTSVREPQSESAPEREDDDRPPMWELAECTCPDFCERDHEQD